MRRRYYKVISFDVREKDFEEIEKVFPSGSTLLDKHSYNRGNSHWISMDYSFEPCLNQEKVLGLVSKLLSLGANRIEVRFPKVKKHN